MLVGLVLVVISRLLIDVVIVRHVSRGDRDAVGLSGRESACLPSLETFTGKFLNLYYVEITTTGRLSHRNSFRVLADRAPLAVFVKRLRRSAVAQRPTWTFGIVAYVCFGADTGPGFASELKNQGLRTVRKPMCEVPSPLLWPCRASGR
jgi:hypothetical protein